MAARQIAIGEGKDHYGQAVGEGNRRDPIEAGACPDHGRGPSADEHERESADELRKKLGGKVVLHFDLRIRTIWPAATISALGISAGASLPTG